MKELNNGRTDDMKRIISKKIKKQKNTAKRLARLYYIWDTNSPIKMSKEKKNKKALEEERRDPEHHRPESNFN